MHGLFAPFFISGNGTITNRKEGIFMADNYTENLNRFVTAINGEVDAKTKEILAEARDERERMIAEAEDKALEDAYSEIQAEVKKITAKYQGIYAQAEQDTRREVLIHREQLCDTLFKNVEKKIEEFVNSEKYQSYLLSRLEGVEITDDTVILVSKRDFSKYKSALNLHTGGRCKIKEDSSIEFGGLSILYENSSMLLEKTIDSDFSEEKKQFSSKYKF